MEIGDKINKAQLEYINQTGKTPKKVYLGQSEMYDFRVWIKDFMDLENRPKVSDGMEFLGMKMFEVTKQNHFNVTE